MSNANAEAKEYVEVAIENCGYVDIAERLKLWEDSATDGLVVGTEKKYYYKNRVSYPALWHIIELRNGFVHLEKTGLFPDRKWVTRERFGKDYFYWIGGPNEDDKYYPR